MVVPDLDLSEAAFVAMGSGCRLVADLPESALLDAVHRIEDLEARWSRFRPESEISQCNKHVGMAVGVSAVTELLVRRAVEASIRTGGRFDPLMLHSLTALGYCHDFRTPHDCDCEPGAPASDSSERTINVENGAVTIPSGFGFDPGGIGKGLAADIVAEELVDAGATWVLVSLGGDLRVAGSHIAEVGWRVEIEDAHDSQHRLGAVRVHGGAIATSSTQKRRWNNGGIDRHHILDPSTQLSADGDRVSATVHAATGWWADCVASTLIADEAIGASDLDQWGATGCAVTNTGEFQDLRLELLQPIGQQL